MSRENCALKTVAQITIVTDRLWRSATDNPGEIDHRVCSHNLGSTFVKGRERTPDGPSQRSQVREAGLWTLQQCDRHAS